MSVKDELMSAGGVDALVLCACTIEMSFEYLIMDQGSEEAKLVHEELSAITQAILDSKCHETALHAYRYMLLRAFSEYPQDYPYIHSSYIRLVNGLPDEDRPDFMNILHDIAPLESVSGWTSIANACFLRCGIYNRLSDYAHKSGAETDMQFSGVPLAERWAFYRDQIAVSVLSISGVEPTIDADGNLIDFEI